MQSSSPLIITLKLDEASQRYFDQLRKQYFPPAINFLSAHLTLFHHLPLDEPAVEQDLAHWSETNPSLLLQVEEVKSIGRGVACKILCPSLVALHKTMQHKWQPWLTQQDRQTLWPHITIQNKVAPELARQTLAQVQARFQPFTATGTGFSLWRYEGGPWQHVNDYYFHGN